MLSGQQKGWRILSNLISFCTLTDRVLVGSPHHHRWRPTSPLSSTSSLLSMRRTLATSAHILLCPRLLVPEPAHPRSEARLQHIHREPGQTTNLTLHSFSQAAALPRRQLKPRGSKCSLSNFCRHHHRHCQSFQAGRANWRVLRPFHAHFRQKNEVHFRGRYIMKLLLWKWILSLSKRCSSGSWESLWVSSQVSPSLCG